MRVTIKKIAQELGISHSTVSRVLNEKQSSLVSESTRERIMQAAHRMGYRPSRIAQALQGKSTQLVGVLVPDTDDYFFQVVIRNLRQRLEESEYELMVFAAAPSRSAAKWHQLLEWDLDGAFVFDYMFYVDGLWEALTRYHGAIPPIVGLFSNKTQLTDHVSVDFSPALGGLLAELRSQGRRRYGYMALAGSFHPSEQRYAVYSDFVVSHGLNLVDMPIRVAESSLMEAAKKTLETWIAEGRPLPDALFCQNDEIALGAYRALSLAGVRIPEQLALAGCDDLPYCRYLETPLTSLTLPVQDVCRQGWSILQRRMAEPEGAPLRIVLDATLKLRESCLGHGSRNDTAGASPTGATAQRSGGSGGRE